MEGTPQGREASGAWGHAPDDSGGGGGGGAPALGASGLGFRVRV